jgi:septin family protein
MKNLALMMALCSIASLNAQSSSKKIEMYERYENGELMEERKSATENGVPIDGFDFDAFKAESLGNNGMSDMNFDSDAKMAEMDQRMKEMQAKTNSMFKTKMAEMEQRMEQMQGRADRMMLENENRMKENRGKAQQNESPTPKLTPQPESKPATNSGSFREA